MGVVINRAGMGTREIYTFCRENTIPILAEIPFDRKIAEAYSQGRIIAEVSTELNTIFSSLQKNIRALAAGDEGELGHA